MTTVDYGTAAVVEGEFVETPTGPTAPPPIPRPDPTHVRMSAFVLLGAMGAAYLGFNKYPEYLEVSATAVFAAIVLFLACLSRYGASK